MVEPDPTFWVAGGAAYLIGALLYMSRVPEKCKPGAFNHFGSSHQIFHFCVIAGALIHYNESLKTFHAR
jgi:adiponectin receptor